MKYMAAVAGFWVSQLYAQTGLPIRAPGDTTLFGNPTCEYWLQVEPKAKEIWIRAILSPVNMGYMQREKPKKDAFTALTSLVPAANYIDHFCKTQPGKTAMTGALNYFNLLIADN